MCVADDNQYALLPCTQKALIDVFGMVRTTIADSNGRLQQVQSVCYKRITCLRIAINPEHQMLPLWFKISYLAFVVLLIPVYILQYGPVNFLWFSNVALMGGLLAAWLESRTIASMMLVSVALLELGWIADFLIGLLLGGTTPIGLVAYMFNPEIPLLVRGLSLYHLPLPFVLFWMVWRLRYDTEAWRPWILIGWGILILTYFLTTPDRNVNWVLGPVGEEQRWMPDWLWLVIVMAGCALIWWLTHKLLTIILARFNRLA